MIKASRMLAISSLLIASLIIAPLASAQGHHKTHPHKASKRHSTRVNSSYRDRRENYKPLGSRHMSRPRQIANEDYYEIEVKVTAYTPHHEQGGGSRTKTGLLVQEGIVAVDPRIIPMHTKLYIPGYGMGIAEDIGGKIKGNHIDVAFGSQSEVNDWGTQYLTIRVYRKKDKDN